MNSIPSFPSLAFPSPAGRPGGQQANALRTVQLADTLTAAYYDSPAEAQPHGGRLTASVGDEPLCLPLIVTRLARSPGGLRHVFLLDVPVRRLCREGLTILRDEAPLAEIDPMALQSPVVDALALLAGLAPEGARRLLRLLLTTGVSLFGKGGQHGVGEIVTRLLETVTPPSLPLQAWCPIGTAAAVASYGLPHGLPAEGFREVVAVEPGRLRRIGGVQADVEVAGDARRLHLFLPAEIPAPSTLVALSDPPLRLAGPSERQPARPLGAWLARRSPRIRAVTRARLVRLAETHPGAAALVDEIACPAPDLPSARIHHLIRTPGGLFYAIGLADSHGLVRGFVARAGEATVALPLGRMAPHPRAGRIQLGFAAIPEPGGADEPVELSLLYRSGRLTRVGSTRPEPLTAVLPDFLAALPAEEVAPPLAAALADAIPARRLRPATLHRVAQSVPSPAVHLVVEVGACPDHLHALAASLEGRRDVVLVLHHRSAEAMAMLRGLAGEVHAVYGLGVEIALPAGRDLMPAERLRAVLAGLTAEATILLSRDTLPEGAGWLDPWLARLAGPAPRIARPLLRHADGSLGPAGIEGAALPEACIGLNAAARAALLRQPLVVPGAAADLQLLAARLGSGSDSVPRPGDPELLATVHAAAEPVPEAIRLAEARLLAREVPQCAS